MKDGQAPVSMHVPEEQLRCGLGLLAANPELDANARQLIADAVAAWQDTSAARDAAERRYRSLFDAVPDPVSIIDWDGTVLDMNTAGLRLFGRPRDKLVGEPIEIINPESDARYRDYWTAYHKLMRRHGVTPDLARAILRTNTTVIAAMMVHQGDADAMICGTFGEYRWHLKYVNEIRAGADTHPIGALSLIILDRGPLFVADSQVNLNPTPQQIADTVIGAARHMRRFGVQPRIALCSSSQFGNLDTESGRNMRAAMAILDGMDLDFEYEGEMPADVALDPELRGRLFPDGRLTGPANGLIYANAEIANAARNMLRSVAGGLEVGPILMGMGNRAHIVTPSITTRGLLNVSVLAGTPVAAYG